MNKNTIKIECFACGKTTSNYKYQPETMRFFGIECLEKLIKIEKGKEIEYMKFPLLSCSVCELPEFVKDTWIGNHQGIIDRHFPNSVLSWKNNQLMCIGCYQKTDEWKEEIRRKKAEENKLEAETKKELEKQREEFKTINGVYPEGFQPIRLKSYDRN